MRSQIDNLNPSAREFYERSRFKLILSLIIASFGMMFLAMVSGSGASAAAAYKVSELIIDIDANTKNSLSALRSGYGFQCFAALLAFFFSVFAALYFSPLYQTPNDKIAIKDPMLLAQLYPDSSSTNNDPNKVN
jgi:hypothetical protein